MDKRIGFKMSRHVSKKIFLCSHLISDRYNYFTSHNTMFHFPPTRNLNSLDPQFRTTVNDTLVTYTIIVETKLSK